MKKPVYFLRFAAIGLIAALPCLSHAQMVGTDIFMQGHYVEVGIGPLGYYGSDASAPTTYHAHPNLGVTGGALGFVADPGMDGWTVGTPPYMGDYFEPGFPAEGWNLQVNGKRVSAVNQGPGTAFDYSGGMGACTGSNTTYSTSGSKIIATWMGWVDSIIVKQVTTLDTTALYFVTQVTLTNTASTPKDNIFYTRTLDPDNDASWTGGSVTTHNVIEYQMPDTSNVSVVSARGTLANSYMALGTTDTASRVVISPGLYILPSVDLDSLYGAADAACPAGDSDFMDQGIAVIISVPHLATVDSAADSVLRTTSTAHRPANSATISFFYAFSPAARDSAFAAGKAGGMHTGALAINNVNAGAAINVYPNPSKDIINVTGLSATDHLSLTDMMGRSQNVNWPVSHDGTNTFSYSGIATGAYLLTVTDANGNMKATVPLRKQ